jgi:uncharacterized membrane protein YphA (DoxX/SURF4 family)
MSSVALAARVVVSVVLLAAGISKARDAAGTRSQLRSFGVAARLVPVVAIALPVVEIVTAIALVAAPGATGPAWIAVALLALFTAVILVNLLRGNRVPCPCFGARTAEPIAPRSIIRNGWLLALAVAGTGSAAGASLALGAVLAAGLGAVTVAVLRVTG